MSKLELVCLLPRSQFVLLLHGARSITVACLKAQGHVSNLTNLAQHPRHHRHHREFYWHPGPNFQRLYLTLGVYSHLYDCDRMFFFFFKSLLDLLQYCFWFFCFVLF